MSGTFSNTIYGGAFGGTRWGQKGGELRDSKTTAQKIADIVALIPLGEENALSAPFLAAMAGLKSTRELRKAVRQARLNGELICSSIKGYFRPIEKAELERFIVTYTCFSDSTREMLTAARRRLKKIEEKGDAGDTE